jgi:hypothetical protein
MVAAGICLLLEQTDLFLLHLFCSALSCAVVELVKSGHDEAGTGNRVRIQSDY